MKDAVNRLTKVDYSSAMTATSATTRIASTRHWRMCHRELGSANGVSCASSATPPRLDMDLNGKPTTRYVDPVLVNKLAHCARITTRRMILSFSVFSAVGRFNIRMLLLQFD